MNWLVIGLFVWANQEIVLKFKNLMYACTLSLAIFVAPSVFAEEALGTFERIKETNKMVVCADPYSYPYSIKNISPPGFDVEIMRALAQLGGFDTEMYWADTGTRGGMSKALRNSIMKGRCDLFAGVGDNGDDDILMGRLTFTDAYMAVGYVLVTQNEANGKSIKEIVDAGMPIGVQMSTPIENWLYEHGIKRALQADNARVMRDMANGVTNVALVFSHAPAVAKKNHPDFNFTIDRTYTPEALFEIVGEDYVGEGLGQQLWNLKFVAQKRDKSFIEFINQGIQTLTENGTIAKLVEKYGVPYFAPIEE